MNEAEIIERIQRLKGMVEVCAFKEGNPIQAKIAELEWELTIKSEPVTQVFLDECSG